MCCDDGSVVCCGGNDCMSAYECVYGLCCYGGSCRVCECRDHISREGLTGLEVPQKENRCQHS